MKPELSIYCLLLLCLQLDLARAQTADRWLADEVSAAAALPSPRHSDTVVSAVLSCEAQRWTLRLDLIAGTGVAEGAGILDIDRKTFGIEFSAEGGGIESVVPRAALEPLRAGSIMTLDLSGPLELALGDPVFTLRGSRIAMEAVAGRCTQRDMSDYRPVTFTPYSSYIQLVRELRKADIEAFAAATASQPAVDAAMAELGDGRRVLFARLCGSSWYFGRSGCNITGYAPSGTEPAWRVVYDTENVQLHIDDRSKQDGWPDVATLPAVPDGMARLWRWNGTVYELAGELPDKREPLALRATID